MVVVAYGIGAGAQVWKCAPPIPGVAAVRMAVGRGESCLDAPGIINGEGGRATGSTKVVVVAGCELYDSVAIG